jgi:signal transduction histidine kinase
MLHRMANETSSDDCSGIFRRPPAQRSGGRLIELVPALLAATARHATAADTAAAIATELVEMAGARYAAVYFADADESMLWLAGWCNAPDAPRQLRVYDVDARDAAVRAARSRLLHLATDESSNHGTTFALPLLSGDRLLGVVECELLSLLDARDFATLDSVGVVLGAIVDRAHREDDARARAEWATVVAHELRQPLGAMALQTQWIASAEVEASVAGMVHRIAGSVSRLNRLINDLTDASLVDVGRVCLKRAPTDLVELTERLVERRSAGDTPRAQIRVQGEIPPMRLDADRIEQVLSNLVANAEKHGRPGAEIDIVIERRIEAVLLSVTSRGPAIPEEQLRSLFDRFFRGDPGKTDGMGVGLYVCRGLVHAHGGSISVRSEGDSTTFFVRFPLCGSRPAIVATRMPAGEHRHGQERARSAPL